MQTINQNAEVIEVLAQTSQGKDYLLMLDEQLRADRNFRIDTSIPRLVAEGNDFEMWSATLSEFYYASDNFVRKTSYTKHDLYTKNWQALLHRDQLYTGMIIRALQRAAETKEPQFNVTPVHPVTEIASKKKIQLMVEVLAIAPFWFGEDDEISGFIAVTTLKKPKEMQ